LRRIASLAFFSKCAIDTLLLLEATYEGIYLG
jgi:hypothetical protein